MEQAQENFHRLTQMCVGKNYSDISKQRSIVEPCPAPPFVPDSDEEIELPSGNRLIVFHNIWKGTVMYDNGKAPCRLNLELDGDVIVAVTHNGMGCYQPF
jgi:hypothetical protein